MFGFNKKASVSLEINDYILRALIKKGGHQAQWIIHEIPLATGIIQDSIIVDEIALFQILKENLIKLGGKKQAVRIFAPDTSVLLKSFEYPSDIADEKLKEYVQMELGQSIHLPFREPLVDVFNQKRGDGLAYLFATPPEEVEKLIGLLLDVHLQPEAVDIRALCNLRLLESLQPLADNKTYMVTNWSINELSICIYSNEQIEFIRYQTINTDLTKWKNTENSSNENEFSYQGEPDDYRILIIDSILELERIMNFFRFSLHKGERSVDEVIIMGDNPLLELVHNLATEYISAPITVVDDRMLQEKYPNFKAKHASLIGLALKEVRI